MTGDGEDREDAARFDALIERSSLGTQGARRLRERIPPAEAESIRLLADLLEALRQAGADDIVAADVGRMLEALRQAGHDHAVVELLVDAAKHGALDETVVSLAMRLAESDPAEASRWLERAADAGNADAMIGLGRVRYQLGHDAQLDGTADPLPGNLTARQAEVLRLLADGLSNKEIAARLYLSRGTVERHLATIYRKLGLGGRVHAARYAVEHGLAQHPNRAML